MSGPQEDRAPLDPTPDQMRAIGYAAVDWIVEKASVIREEPVADLRALSDLLDEVGEELPVSGTSFEDTIVFIDRQVVSRMTRTNHPRFHAYVPGPGSYYGALGNLILSALNPFGGSSLGGASFSAIELVALRWIAEAIGYPPSAEGIFTSGGSMANLGALAAARATVADPAAAVIYVSDQGHASMDKAARVLGFRPDQIVRLPTDDELRLRADTVLARSQEDRSNGLVPLFLSANAGTTNTGAVDPLMELSEVCDRAELWFHVDAAYGGFAAMTERGRGLLMGMELADSITLDPHKWLYTPFGCGCLLVNRPGSLERAFAAGGEYLRDIADTEVNFYDRGPELSRPPRGFAVWMLIRTVGIDELRRQIDADLDLAEYAAALLAAEPDFEVVQRGLSIVSFRLVADSGESEHARASREEALVQRLLVGGDALVSGTTIGGRSALRFVVLNHRTNSAEIRRSVAALRDAAHRR